MADRILTAALAITTCAADNCLRAIRASAFPTRHATTDCSSYFLTTVTPATYTSTVYPTETVYANKKKRAPSAFFTPPQPTTVIPTAIPAYASPCSGSVRYSSACSCVGVTPSITTAATPTIVITVPGPTQTVVETRLQVNFIENYGDNCDGSNEGTGYFVEGDCNYFVYPDSLSLTGINPGTCTDTSSCYIQLHASPDCSDSFKGLVLSGSFNTCIDIANTKAGILICPDC